MLRHDVFFSGGTGYIGRPVAAELVRRGHSVQTIARTHSLDKVARGATPVLADALAPDTFARHIPAGATFLHLTGVPHPAPWKARAFRNVDLRSLAASGAAAQQACVSHFVYVSVARPAPVMRAYIDVRCECERIIERAGLSATILRPWYVLGPGHRWPVVLAPFYAAARLLSITRPAADRLGLVTLDQMVTALIHAVEHPAQSIRVLDVPAIRARSVVAAQTA